MDGALKYHHDALLKEPSIRVGLTTYVYMYVQYTCSLRVVSELHAANLDTSRDTKHLC